MKLILLPGLDGTGQLFKPLLEVLSPDLPVQEITYPKHEKLGYSALIEYVNSALPIDEDYILLGESFSGPIAYQIALNRPKSLRLVIFVATFLDNPRPRLLSVTKSLPREKLLGIPIPNIFMRWFMLGKNANVSLLALCRKSVQQVSPNVLEFRLDEIARLAANHQKCSCQALYIQAIDDQLVPPDSLMRFVESMENLRISKLAGPHMILQTKPHECAEIIEQEWRKL